MSLIAKESVVIVTGAGSGVGRALCMQLANDGYRLVVVGRNEGTLKDTIALCNWNGAAVDDRVLVVRADVADVQECGLIVQTALEKFGRIDALVNNAAIAPVLPIEATTRAAMEDAFAVNVFGPAQLIAACWPIFKRQNAGRVVNVSSIATIDPFPGLAVYAASKAALESLTRSIIAEGNSHNIRGFSIVLGAVETDMLRQVVTNEQLPTDQTLDPSDAAAIIAECATGLRDQDAGQSIVVQKNRPS